MSSLEEAQLTPLLWSMVDRWLEPPWRALLTWMLLAALSGAVFYSSLGMQIVNLGIALGRKFSTWGMPSIFLGLPFLGAIVPPWIWYQPVVLRIGLLRAVVWIIGAILTADATTHLPDLFNPMGPLIQIWAWPTLAGLLLIGYWSRPWMSLPAGALALAVAFCLRNLLGVQAWSWWVPISSLPYAAVMLYGTRRLRPEERSQSPK